MGTDQTTKSHPSRSHSRQLDFDPQSFVNVGSWLSAQERRPSRTSSTQTVDPPRPPREATIISRRVVLALLAFVAALLGTNAYSFNENRAWKAERSTMQAKIAELESVANRTSRAQMPPESPSNACPGSDLVDTCWFKVGLGNCAKDVLGDPVGRVEGVWRFAWDSTAEVIGHVGETIASDLHQIGMEFHSAGRAALHFFGLAGDSS